MYKLQTNQWWIQLWADQSGPLAPLTSWSWACGCMKHSASDTGASFLCPWTQLGLCSVRSPWCTPWQFLDPPLKQTKTGKSAVLQYQQEALLAVQDHSLLSHSFLPFYDQTNEEIFSCDAALLTHLEAPVSAM